MRHAWTIALAALAWANHAPARAADAEPKKLKAVLWIGGHSHDFKAMADILAEALPKLAPMEIEIVKDGSFLDAPAAKAPDVILMNHCFDNEKGVLDDAKKKKLMDRVRGGTGVVAIHASYYSFVKWEEFRELFGTRFVKHGSSKAMLTVRVTDKDHPVVRGIAESFEVMSELYESKPLADDCRVLAVAREKGKDREHPSVWTRTVGRGRVVAILPAHGPDAFKVPAFQALIANSARWAAGESAP